MNLITNVIAIPHNKAEKDVSMWRLNEVKINLLLPCNVRAVDYSFHSSLVIGEYFGKFCMKHLTNSKENIKSKKKTMWTVDTLRRSVFKISIVQAAWFF